MKPYYQCKAKEPPEKHMWITERIAYRLETGGKTCRDCLEVRPVTEYVKDRKSSDGLESTCVGCHR